MGSEEEGPPRHIVARQTEGKSAPLHWRPLEVVAFWQSISLPRGGQSGAAFLCLLAVICDGERRATLALRPANLRRVNAPRRASDWGQWATVG